MTIKKEYIYGNGKKQDDYMSATYNNEWLESVEQYFSFEDQPKTVYINNHDLVKIVSKMDMYGQAEIAKDIINNIVDQMLKNDTPNEEIRPLYEAIGAMIDVMKGSR